MRVVPPLCRSDDSSARVPQMSPAVGNQRVLRNDWIIRMCREATEERMTQPWYSQHHEHSNWEVHGRYKERMTTTMEVCLAQNPCLLVNSSNYSVHGRSGRRDVDGKSTEESTWEGTRTMRVRTLGTGTWKCPSGRLVTEWSVGLCGQSQTII